MFLLVAPNPQIVVGVVIAVSLSAIVFWCSCGAKKGGKVAPEAKSRARARAKKKKKGKRDKKARPAESNASCSVVLCSALLTP